MAYESYLSSVAENTSGYGVKLFESTASGSSTLEWFYGTAFVSYTNTYSECYTRTYSVGNTTDGGYYGAYNNSISEIRERGLLSNGVTSYITNTGHAQTGGGAALSFYGSTSISNIRVTTLNTDFETEWICQYYITEYHSNTGSVNAIPSSGITSTSYSNNGCDLLAFFNESYLRTTTTTDLVIGALYPISSEATSVFFSQSYDSENESFVTVIDESTTYQVLHNNSPSNKTLTGIKTYVTYDISVLGTGPRSYSYSVICPYDREGNSFLTGLSGFSSGIRQSDYNIFLGGSLTRETSFSSQDIIFSNFQSTQTSGYSSSYSFSQNYVALQYTTITETFLASTFIGVVSDQPIFYGSTTTLSRGITFLGKSQTTITCVYGDGQYFNPYVPYGSDTFGSHASATCLQVLPTAKTVPIYRFDGMFSTSFEFAHQIGFISTHTHFVNRGFGSTSGGSSSSYSTSFPATNGSESYSESNSNTNRYGATTYSIAQPLQSSKAALVTFGAWDEFYDRPDGYYTEKLNAGLFYSQGGGYFDFAGHGQSVILSSSLNNIYQYPRPNILLAPFGGTVPISSGTFFQTYSKGSDNTTITTSFTNSGSSSSGSFLFSFSKTSEITYGVQGSMPLDTYSFYNAIAPLAQDILHSKGYFASDGSYEFERGLSSSSNSVQYITGTASHPVHISTYIAPYHGVFTATSVLPNAQISSPQGGLFLPIHPILENQFVLNFSQSWGTEY